MEWKEIETYVFCDTETTGLITNEIVPAITELCMLAIKREHLLNYSRDEELRVQYKLLMCFRPYKEMTDKSVELSGLNEQLLEHEARKHYNLDVFNTISSFINCLQSPVCLIAHNGFKFHFPILKHYFQEMDFQLSPDVKSTDSLIAFYNLLEAEKIENIDLVFASEKTTKVKSFSEIMRVPYHAPNPHPNEPYELKDIYSRIVDGASLDPKRAENQCIMMMKIAHTRAERFVQWVAANHCAFSEVPVAVPKSE